MTNTEPCELHEMIGCQVCYPRPDPPADPDSRSFVARYPAASARAATCPSTPARAGSCFGRAAPAGTASTRGAPDGERETVEDAVSGLRTAGSRRVHGREHVVPGESGPPQREGPAVPEVGGDRRPPGRSANARGGDRDR